MTVGGRIRIFFAILAYGCMGSLWGQAQGTAAGAGVQSSLRGKLAGADVFRQGNTYVLHEGTYGTEPQAGYNGAVLATHYFNKDSVEWKAGAQPLGDLESASQGIKAEGDLTALVSKINSDSDFLLQKWTQDSQHATSIPASYLGTLQFDNRFAASS